MKEAFQEGHFLNAQKQRLLCLCFDSEFVNFNSQRVYTNQRSFHKAALELCKGGLLRGEKAISTSGFFDRYKLTNDGLAFVEILRGFLRGNNSKN